MILYKDNITKPVVEAEVSAMIRYVSEQGCDKDANVLSDAHTALLRYQSVSDEDDVGALQTDMLKQYAKLIATAGNSGVTGRTLIDTCKSGRLLALLSVLTLSLLVLAFADLILGVWISEMPEPEESMLVMIRDVQLYVLTPLSPFFWGAVGSCVYLLKSLYDIAQDRMFDNQKLGGWWIRVMLGGILGVVVVSIFNLSNFSTERVDLDANAVAFLVGLGVKVVYGGFESMVQVLSEKMNLDSLRKSRSQDNKNSGNIKRLDGVAEV